MPAYSWLFEVKEYAYPGDVIINVPDQYRQGITGKIIASKEALELVAYLKSFKQIKLPDGKPTPIFLYGKEIKTEPTGTTSKLNTELDGAALYAVNCQSCHQENGEGLKGAFPPLKGSPVVLDKNPKVQLTIIMKGYNGRASEGYGIMPAVGTNNNLKPEEILAIINHERSSWGNNSRKITLLELKELYNQVKTGPIAK
ncbi:MAG: c-type cytochrome [Mucilaginibacter sp.]|uniref:c-type cytochrome n=1 Tax=Mucilaginibacter sp. TaxID=1882438 RepID=UPI0032643B87